MPSPYVMSVADAHVAPGQELSDRFDGLLTHRGGRCAGQPFLDETRYLRQMTRKSVDSAPATGVVCGCSLKRRAEAAAVTTLKLSV
jgi:hypothetical protein